MARDKSLPILQNLAVNENKMHLSSLYEHLIFFLLSPCLSLSLSPSLSLHTYTRTHTQGLLMYESKALALIVQL